MFVHVQQNICVQLKLKRWSVWYSGILKGMPSGDYEAGIYICPHWTAAIPHASLRIAYRWRAISEMIRAFLFMSWSLVIIRSSWKTFETMPFCLHIYWPTRQTSLSCSVDGLWPPHPLPNELWPAECMALRWIIMDLCPIASWLSLEHGILYMDVTFQLKTQDITLFFIMLSTIVPDS